ncbi:AAA family ATPase [Propionispora hippei]|uniref:Predicted kinase n=1 Tax=Propionispora hippei DSM 15287 TaxID=1123003 RepID=A0A1M6DW19_9FIRM|nr:ATP-binding protein [Propionispora hippei]SHI77411.1 Predicted kinase [Propionispora hippei DSM 15287]
MKKTLILLAGFPGTGKTYLANKIRQWQPAFILLSPDAIKEKFWDEQGFDNLAEKEATIRLSWAYYYDKLRDYMQAGSAVMSDYPFSNKQKDNLAGLAKQYGYQIITLRLTGDLAVLFERQKQRDLDVSRHWGHVLTSYHQGQQPTDRHEADALLDYDEFSKRCLTRGYGEFSLGYLIKLDMTDFSAVNYEELCRQMKELLR